MTLRNILKIFDGILWFNTLKKFKNRSLYLSNNDLLNQL